MIRYGEAKKVLAKYRGAAGRCPDDSPELDLFVKQVLQYLLLNGAYGNERRFVFCAENGCITLPYELDTPLKVKIDGCIGTVWNRWFEYHSGNQIEDCCLAKEALLDDPNRYATIYDVPVGGSQIGVIGTCCEDEDASVVIKGTDPTGRPIYTFHQGKEIVGEYLSIKKGTITLSTVVFGQVTEVAKTVTKGYVQLLAVSCDGRSRKFLADYSPKETDPSYHRMKLLTRPCPPISKVSILGRIRLKEYYADDDLIPFDNHYLLDVAGQTVNSMYNTDLQSAIAKDQYVKGLIETEDNYKKINNGQPVEVYRPLSGGAIMNLRPRLGWGYWRGR